MQDAEPSDNSSMPETIDYPDAILIIDDSVPIIRMLSTLLHGMAEVLFATSGEAGIELARKHRPQLILLDLEMPGMDGFEVCRRLKNDPDTRDSAVLIVTANASDQAEISALEAGAVDFITKPLNPPVVRARVSTHLTLQRQTEALKQFALHDGLTGLFNRRYFDTQLALECQRHRRQQVPLGLAMIDIDHFKRYNDRDGHLAGDDCLRQVATAIDVATRRPGEVVARFGGEEFAVIIPHGSHDDTCKYGQWICERVRSLALPHPDSPTAPIVTISVGLVSQVPLEDGDAMRLISLADEALYRAKSTGRNRFVFSGANAATGSTHAGITDMDKL